MIMRTKRLYIDIDGVLLTNKNTQRPQYAVEFIDYITSTFDCYWLTSHCKEGNSTYLLQYTSLYYDENTIEKLKKIKPTSWLTAKTEAIDLDSDFYWLDDYVFEFEKKVLKEYRKYERWIEVNLSQENELKRIKELLVEKQSFNRKCLFLDIDGVLNTSRYSKYMIENNLNDFDENGSIFDPNAVDNLRYVIDCTNADVIISSTWRYDGLDKMQKLWEDRNMPGKIVGITPHMITASFEEVDSKDIWQKRPIGSRGMEIDEWLRLNTNEMLEPYTYVIVDDEDDFLLHQASHVVLTDPNFGLTKVIASIIINKLNISI